MTFKRTLLASLVLILSVSLGVFIYNTANAAGESWYWNSTDTLQAQGGVFGSGVELSSSNNNDSVSPEFELSEAAIERGVASSSYACIGEKDNTAMADLSDRGRCKTPADPDAANRCRDKSDGDCADVFIVLCHVNRLTVEVDKDNNSVSAKNFNSYVEIITDNVHEIESPMINLHNCADISFGTIKNNQGDFAADTTLNEGLEEERQRLVEEYIKKECGDNPSPECASSAREAFNTIFDACITNADNIAVSDEASAQAKINSIAICVEQNAGVKIDSQKLEVGLLAVMNYEEEKPSCALEWIGWIICPVTRFMGELADTGFEALEKLLVIQPMERGSQGGDSLFLAWSLMRNVANVLFVIAFLVIIYSQLTGFGLDNYGIKKLLPRIIIAALLVNTSFYIALIMVDISNILGSSLYNVLRGYAESLNLSLTFDKDFGWGMIIESIIGVTAAGVAIAGAALYGSLAALVPLLTTVILALLTAIMLLVGRYAFIVILIIVAPVAFVAYLLPNTQKWFNMWYKTFLGLLMLYPIMGLIYGGSYLAGIIVMNSAGSSSQGVKDDLLQLFGLSLTAIPLLLTPIIMKFGGGVINKWGGQIKNNGLFKKANTRANEYSERKKNARDLRGLQRFGDKRRTGLPGLRDKAIQRRFKREGIRSARGGQLQKATSAHISAYISEEEGSGGDKKSLLERAKTGAKNIAGNDYGQDEPRTKGQEYADSLAKGGDANALNRALSKAVNAKLSVHNEAVATANEMLTNNFSEQDWMRIATGMDAEHNSLAVRQAAIEKIAALQDNGIDEIVKHSGSMDGQLRYALARSVQKNNSTPLYNNPTAVKTIMNGGVTDTQGNFQPLTESNFHQQIVATSIAEGHLTQADLATAEHETITDIQTAIDQGHVSASDAQKVSQQAGFALDNKYTNERATESTRAGLEKLSGRRP